MAEKWIELATADGPMDAYLATPDGGAAGPAMVVVQEAFGVNAHIQDVARRLAAEGYVAIAPEVYHRQGSRRVFGYDEFPKLRPIFATLTNDMLAMDIGAALEHLRGRSELDGKRLGVTGFCLGGFAAFLAATRLEVKTSVAFYGGGAVNERPGLGLRPVIGDFGKIRGSVLAFFGEADQSIPPEDVAAVRQALEQAHVKHEVVTYPGAQHGFFCDLRASYHREAALDAWARTKAWLAREL